MDAILTATAQPLVADGYARLSTNRIAERAGASVGTLYQYFEHKEAIAEAVVERLVARQLEAFTTDVMTLHAADEDLEGGARALLSGLLSVQRIDLELSGVLLREAPRGGEQDLEQAWLRRSCDVLKATLGVRRSQYRDGDLDLMLYVLVTGVNAVLQDALAHRPELVTTGALTEELAQLAIAYLRPVRGDRVG